MSSHDAATAETFFLSETTDSHVCVLPETHLAGFKGPTSKGTKCKEGRAEGKVREEREGEGKKEKGWKGGGKVAHGCQSEWTPLVVGDHLFTGHVTQPNCSVKNV